MAKQRENLNKNNKLPTNNENSTIQISILFGERTHGLSQCEHDTFTQKCLWPCVLIACDSFRTRHFFRSWCFHYEAREKNEGETNAKLKQYSFFGQLVDFDVAFTYASFITKCKTQRFFRSLFAVICLGPGLQVLYFIECKRTNRRRLDKSCDISWELFANPFITLCDFSNLFVPFRKSFFSDLHFRFYHPAFHTLRQFWYHRQHENELIEIQSFARVASLITHSRFSMTTQTIDDGNKLERIIMRRFCVHFTDGKRAKVLLILFFCLGKDFSHVIFMKKSMSHKWDGTVFILSSESLWIFIRKANFSATNADSNSLSYVENSKWQWTIIRVCVSNIKTQQHNLIAKTYDDYFNGYITQTQRTERKKWQYCSFFDHHDSLRFNTKMSGEVHKPCKMALAIKQITRSLEM